MEQQPSRALRLKLQDGTLVLVRPVIPEDRHPIEVGMTRLSAESRYLRFFSPVPQLSDEQLRYFTEVDHYNHVAWIAFESEESYETGIGIGRAVRLPDQPQIGEVALTVIDVCQHRGLGTILLALLYRDAQRCGVSTLRGFILPENRSMALWMLRLGAVETYVDGLFQFDLPVLSDWSRLPQNPSAQRFRQALELISSASLARQHESGSSEGGCDSSK